MFLGPWSFLIMATGKLTMPGGKYPRPPFLCSDLLVISYHSCMTHRLCRGVADTLPHTLYVHRYPMNTYFRERRLSRRFQNKPTNKGSIDSSAGFPLTHWAGLWPLLSGYDTSRIFSQRGAVFAGSGYFRREKSIVSEGAACTGRGREHWIRVRGVDLEDGIVGIRVICSGLYRVAGFVWQYSRVNIGAFMEANIVIIRGFYIMDDITVDISIRQWLEIAITQSLDGARV